MRPMSLKSLLLPAFTERLLSRPRLLAKRARAEQRRLARRGRHEVHYFHQVDDPYSALAASVLPRLVARYDLELVPHVVGPPPDEAAPDRERLVAYSRKDAQLLAETHRERLAFRDTGEQPPAAAVARATALLVAAIDARRFADLAEHVSTSLWTGTDFTSTLVPSSAETVASHVAGAEALRKRLGHYLGATFFYAGEWYWGIDRLYHLEKRLQLLGAQRSGIRGLLYPPRKDLDEETPLASPPPIDFFFSLRSPYSAIVAPRVFALGRLTGAEVRLRYVLPMVMRGLAVPRAKRMYIVHDVAREAFERGLPFGRLNDPLGKPTERGLALLAHAMRADKGEAFVTSFMRGVWAEGLDAGSERGLRTIAERAGLPWDDARAALADDAWRSTAEANRAEMFELGLWGVPSFRVGDVTTWGQDRLWVVEEALLRGPRSASRTST
jgi:2-hydroxychromene-2-carboxylate isomerase